MGDVIHILGSLVFIDVLFEGRERDRSGRSFCVAVIDAEFVDDLADEPSGNSGGVCLVGDSNTGDAIIVRVNVEDKF